MLDCVRVPFPELQHHYYENMKTTYLPKVSLIFVKNKIENEIWQWHNTIGHKPCSCLAVKMKVKLVMIGVCFIGPLRLG